MKPPAGIAVPMRLLRNRLLHRMGSHHIAGPELQDALNVCRRANTAGYPATLALWTCPSESTETIIGKYKQTLSEIAGLDARMAIKVPALNHNKALLGELIQIAQDGSVGLQFDSQGFETFEQTFELVQWARARYEHIGCTLPSRWARSLIIAEQAVNLRIAVRIVKGQWRDPAATHMDSRKNFLAIVEALAGRAVHVSVATHDRPLANTALQILKASNTQCELEQMFGLPLPTESALQKLDVPMRLCIPFGHPDLPYSIRYVAERPAIALWAVKDLLESAPSVA